LSLITDIVSRHLQPAEDFTYGFAVLTGLIDEKFGEFQFGISIGKRLDSRIVNQVVKGPTLEYFNHYRAMNEELSRISRRLSADLNQAGIRTVTISPSVTTEELNTTYNTTLRTDLSHKMVATRAGLGWIGKTALFVSKKFGPSLRLVTILTSTPVIPSVRPVNKSHCGPCTRCVDACPAQAATGQLWDISIDRNQFFDAHKCRNQCALFGKQLKQDIRICGICVAVCPLNQKV